MCGIAIAIDQTCSVEELDRRATIAVASLHHRGPDGNGIVTRLGWTIAHTRLAIIDPIGNSQPISSPDSRYWLTYNGEIYNYQQLRKSLEPRWSFRTNGDTEVLLAGLVIEGTDFLQRLNGMWAFAFWDTTERKLLLSRDRLGKKPLYYRNLKEGFAAASELQPLKRLLPTAEWCEDHDSTADFFRYGFALPGFTGYRDVHEVLPGHCLEWSSEAGIREYGYWSLSDGNSQKNFASHGGNVREILEDSVRLRLVADVDVGAFLSGGIDSSLVSTLAARQIGHRLRTFSIGFSDPAYDESAEAKRIADTIHSDHASAIVTMDDADLASHLLMENVGQPFADASLLPTSLLSQLAARHVKVALSGDGADELFAGYQRYIGRVLLRWYTRLPASCRHLGDKIVRSFPEPLHHHSRSILKKAHLFISANGASSTTPYVAPRLFDDASVKEFLPDFSSRGHVPPGLPEISALDDVHEMMVADTLIYLPQDILVKTDRASMAHSLEVRCPFLDHRLVELALSNRSATHIRRWQGKQILRKECSDILPAWVWQRRKQGFAVPTGSWFHGPLGEKLETLVAESNSGVSKAACRAMLKRHRSGARDHGQQLWALWSYFQWIRAQSAHS